MQLDPTQFPVRIASLPRDERGYPVPWFVPWIDGRPAFHAADARKIVAAITDSSCWICGEKLGRNRAFVIGPMCTVNRISAEPPMHLECAEFSAKVCPFLTKPKMRRLPPIEGGVKGPGNMIERNPGVCAIWVCRKYDIERHAGGFLFRVGDPESVSWFAEGRAATRDEVQDSLDSGLPILQKLAEEQSDFAEAALASMVAKAAAFLPKGAA